MNLCFLCREYPPAPRVGGIGFATRDRARALALLGHRVHVVAPIRDGGSPTTLTDEGVVVHRIRSPRWQIPGLGRRAGQTLDRLGWSWAAARVVARLRREEGLDAVEAPEFAAEGFVVAHRSDPPVVVRLHTPLGMVRRLNGTQLSADCRRTVRLERAALEGAAAVIAPSRALVAACVASGYGAAGRAEIVPHGIDTDLFSPGDPPGGGDPLVLFVGRLEARKGVGDLLRALPAIAAGVPQTRFAFVGAEAAAPPGATSWRDRVLAEARMARIEEQVEVAGFVPREELPSWYRSASVVVAPSPFEAFGLVCLEAMACGRPVVGCAAGAFPELVRDGHEGRAVPPGDPEALAAAVVELLEDPGEAMAMGRRARRRAVEEFALDRVVCRDAELYAAVAERRPR